MLGIVKRLSTMLAPNRESSAADPYGYSVSEKTRMRILHTMRQHREDWMTSQGYDFGAVIREVEQLLLAKRGDLSTGQDVYQCDVPIVAYFLTCSDEEAVDLVALCFRTNSMGGDNRNSRGLVASVNRIFEEEAIGYELTPPATVDTGEKGFLFGRATGGNVFRTEYPRIVRKNDRTVHDKVVLPALESLREARFAIANAELLNAFEEVRQGNYADAITSCGAAFESVLKSICNAKGWAYDPSTDACAKLVSICRDNGLFFPFYSPTFEGVGTVRNKLGDAHGKGPTPAFVAGREHADHMIAVTCAHIEFLIRQAGL